MLFCFCIPALVQFCFHPVKLNAGLALYSKSVTGLYPFPHDGVTLFYRVKHPDNTVPSQIRPKRVTLRRLRCTTNIPDSQVYLNSLDVFYVWIMSASPKSDTRPYPIPLDGLWTYLGRKKEIKKSLTINLFLDVDFRFLFLISSFLIVVVVLTRFHADIRINSNSQTKARDSGSSTIQIRHDFLLNERK